MRLKEILMTTLVATVFVGCNHSDDNYTTPAPGVKVRVEAGVTENGTRTEFNGDQNNPVASWSEGDAIKVVAFDVNNGNYLTEAVLTTESTATSGTFSGTVTDAQYAKIPVGSTYNYVAAYPSGANVATDGKTVSFDVPSSYTANPDDFNGEQFDFMVAAADNCASIAVEGATAEYPKFGFEHVLAFLEITLAGNDPIKTVKVEAPAAICGTVTVDPKGDLTPAVSGGANTITVTLNGNLTTNQRLYVPVIPGIAHTGTLTVTLTCASGSTHTITKQLSGKTFTRGKVTPVSNIGYAMADDCITQGEVRSYVENNANNAVTSADGLQVSATLTDNTLKTDEITFYYSTSSNGTGTAISGTKNVSGQTVTLTASNSAWSDKDIYVWAEVNHNGNIKTTERKVIYVIGSGDILTTSAYTSYSKYLANDITTANGCDGLSIYDASYTLAKKNVPSRISQSGITVTDNDATVTAGNLTGRAMGSHTLKGSITIGGKTFTSSDYTVHITGLPYSISINTSATAKDSYFVTQMGWINNGGSWYTVADYYIQQQRSSDYVISPEFHIPSPSLNVTTTVNAFSIATLKNNRLAYVGAVARTAEAGAKDVQFEVQYNIGTAQNVSNSMALSPDKPCVSLTKYNSVGNNRIEGISISYR